MEEIEMRGELGAIHFGETPEGNIYVNDAKGEEITISRRDCIKVAARLLAFAGEE